MNPLRRLATFVVLHCLYAVSVHAAPFFSPDNWLVVGGGIAVAKESNGPDALTFRLTTLPIVGNEGRAIELQSTAFGDFEFDYQFVYGGLLDSQDFDPITPYFTYFGADMTVDLAAVRDINGDGFLIGNATTSGRLSAQRFGTRAPVFVFERIGTQSNFGGVLTISAVRPPPPPPRDVPAPAAITALAAVVLAVRRRRRAAR